MNTLKLWVKTSKHRWFSNPGNTFLFFWKSLKWGQHPLKSAFNIPPWVSLKNLVQIKGRSGCFTMVNHSKEKNMSSFDIFCWWFSTNIADILWMGQRIPVLPIWDGFSTQTKSWDAYHLPTSDSDFATIHSSKELKDEFYPSSRGGIMVYYASPCLESALGFGLDFNPFPLILNTPPLQKKTADLRTYSF